MSIFYLLFIFVPATFVHILVSDEPSALETGAEEMTCAGEEEGEEKDIAGVESGTLKTYLTYAYT